ncbi:MAG: zinc ribbon domain-containing protein [Coprococcus sp.]
MSAGGKFTQILEELCNKFGKLLIRVGRWYPSSKTCSHCGSIDKDLKLNDRVYECSECGHTMNRDKNAAVNILEEAFRILEENMFRPSVEGYKKPALISTIA